MSQILRLLRGASVTVFSQAADLHYRWISNPPATWGEASDIRGKTDADLLPPGAAAASLAVKRAVLSSGRPHWTEFTLEDNHRRQTFELYVEADAKSGGIIGLALNVTERRKRMAALEAAVRQSAHRSRNLLAVLQSLATQSARASASTDEFIVKYREHIQSISRSQDLALGDSSPGAKLWDLVSTHVRSHVADAAVRVSVDGPDCHLTPNAALHLGLALSELTIAAVSTGALSRADGQVLVTAERAIEPAIDAADPCIRLTWVERGDRPSPLPERFSRRLLERLVPAALGGQSSLTSTDDGMRFDLTIGPGEFH